MTWNGIRLRRQFGKGEKQCGRSSLHQFYNVYTSAYTCSLTTIPGIHMSVS